MNLGTVILLKINFINNYGDFLKLSICLTSGVDADSHKTSE